jgi:hypothetical protein
MKNRFLKKEIGKYSTKELLSLYSLLKSEPRIIQHDSTRLFVTILFFLLVIFIGLKWAEKNYILIKKFL